MPTTAPPGPVAVLDGAFQYACVALAEARTCSLSVPTPCDSWDLGDLLQHMGDAVLTIAEAAAVDSEPLTGPHRSPEMLVDRVRRRARSAQDAWLARPTSGAVRVDDLLLGRDTMVLVAAVEIAVHGWDVARAVGLPAAIPEELAITLDHVARTVVTRGERARRFAPPLFVPPSAPAGARLLAHLGRSPA